jgi:lysophospholipase L1-like esterase
LVGYLVIARWRSAGIETACTQRWEGFSASVRQAAQARGITFVSVYDAVHGKGHDQDPVQLGYIGADGEHTSAKGAQLIADTLAASGFAPILPR